MDVLPKGRLSESEVLIQRPTLKEKALKEILFNLNLKVTKQRVLILKSMCEGRIHVTAQELHEKVKIKDSSIRTGIVTIYRFLKILCESGYATEIRSLKGPSRYELKIGDHHDHLTCVYCGKLIEFENSKIEKLQNVVASQFGFILVDHVLELYGVCPDSQCRKIYKKS